MSKNHLAGSQYNERSERSLTGGIALGLDHLKKSAWRAVPWIFATTILLVCCSCSTQKHITQTVRDVQKDTVYLSNIQYDSIYISQDKLIDRSKDTLCIRDVSVEYRYKLLRDTVRIVQRDSIPYEVTIVQTKEIKRPLTWYDHLSHAILWLNIGFVLLLFVRFIRKLKAFGS